MEIGQAIEYVQDIPSETDRNDQNVNNLIIIEDMMDNATQDNQISQIFTRG